MLASLLQAASLAPGPGLHQLSPRTVQRLPPSQATTLAPGLVSAVPLHRDNAGVSSHVSRVMMIVTCHVSRSCCGVTRSSTCHATWRSRGAASAAPPSRIWR